MDQKVHWNTSSGDEMGEYYTLLRRKWDIDPDYDLLIEFYKKFIPAKASKTNPRWDDLTSIVNHRSNIDNKYLAALCRRSPDIILKIKENHKKYRYMMIQAIKNRPDLFQKLNKAREDLSMCKFAAACEPHCIKYVKVDDPSIFKIAMKINPTVYKSVPRKYRTYEDYLAYKNYESSLKKELEIIRNICETPIEPPIQIGRRFGVELEFILPDHTDLDEIYTLVKRYVKVADEIPSSFDRIKYQQDKQLWYFTKDGTAEDVYELSSKVLSDSSIGELYKVANILTILNKFNKISMNDNCGLHVHMDASDMSFEKVIRISKFYKDNDIIIQNLLKNTRAGNLYCRMHTNVALLNYLNNMYKFESCSPDELRSDRHYAVNVMSYFYYKTIEFRQHEGTLSFSNMLHWIYLLSKIVNNATNAKCITMNQLFDVLDIPEPIRNTYRKKYLSSK